MKIQNDDEEMKSHDESHVEGHDEESMMLSEDEIPLFSSEDIDNAIKDSNFNKGLGPDYFDGNLIKNNETLRVKINFEIANALNMRVIPDHLRSGRLVPLQKTLTKGPVSLDDIRPIVVRSHISKIMEKAILQKIHDTCPHLIATKMYQTGFKESKSTAIHISRLLHEVHGPKKRKFNMLIDLQKAYDSVDREKLFKILFMRCQNEDEKNLVKLMIKLHR